MHGLDWAQAWCEHLLDCWDTKTSEVLAQPTLGLVKEFKAS